MLPLTVSVKGVTFHLGETLLAEAHIQVGEQKGYAAYRFFPDEAAFAGSTAEQTLLSIEQASVGTIVDPEGGATVISGCGLGLVS